MLSFLKSRVKQARPDYSERFERDGFLVLERFFKPALCDRVAAEAESYYARQNVPISRVDRTLNMHQECPTARKMLGDPALRDVVRNILGNEPFFLQSIYFHRGSQQSMHSDYIYMSTEPALQLCGVWIACEDVSPDAGPLTYYPGSHKIPINSVADYYEQNVESVRAEIENDRPALELKYGERMKMTGESMLGCHFYDRWLSQLHSAVEQGGYQSLSFLPKKGDVIIWHANLAHGGSGIKDAERSRKSLVAHFLTEAVQKYYDMQYVNNKSHIELKSIPKDRPAILQVRG
jgi:ectoine hydroxylase-related dioxygenase (phytanoyl-CoA dioxygenase family)